MEARTLEGGAVVLPERAENAMEVTDYPLFEAALSRLQRLRVAMTSDLQPRGLPRHGCGSCRSCPAMLPYCVLKGTLDADHETGAPASQRVSVVTGELSTIGPHGSNSRHNTTHGATLPLEFLNHFKRRFGFKSPPSQGFKECSPP